MSNNEILFQYDDQLQPSDIWDEPEEGNLDFLGDIILDDVEGTVSDAKLLESSWDNNEAEPTEDENPIGYLLDPEEWIM